MFCLSSTFAAKYNVKVNVFSNDKSFSRQPFSFYLDFEREVNLSSLKMTVSGDKKKEIPVYAIPVAKYKALIYFMPHKNMAEDSELNYILSFESGKWDNKAVGSNELKDKIKRNPNLVPNYSFEKVRNAIERFMTWEGRTSITDWSLQDFSGKYLSVKNIKSTCRSSNKEAFHGSRSLCITNGQPREIEAGGKTENVLISGSADTSKLIVLKPDTTYKLSFFVKITKQVDNGLNFQGVGITLSFLDDRKSPVPNGMFGALYSIGSIPQEEYLNKWIYVEACGKTNPDTGFGTISIAEKISGTTYIDMLELREVKSPDFPEIIVRKSK
jgi:hypothetical protein